MYGSEEDDEERKEDYKFNRVAENSRQGGNIQSAEIDEFEIEQMDEVDQIDQATLEKLFGKKFVQDSEEAARFESNLLVTDRVSKVLNEEEIQ